MARYRVVLTRSARKELRRLPPGPQDRLLEALERLSEAGTQRRSGNDVQPLKGHRGWWRLRVGVYRAIFERDRRVLVVTRIAHRSSVYRL